MKALNILYVAAWRIFTNLGVALLLSLPWFAIMALLALASWFAYVQIGEFTQIFGLLITFGAVIFGSICMSVGWHRFCLLGEKPSEILHIPSRELLLKYTRAMTKYFFVMLFLGIIFLILAKILMIIVTLFMGPMQTPDVALAEQLNRFAAKVLVLPLYVFGLGYGLILPAAALNRDFRIGEAFVAIRENFWTMTVLVIFFAVLSFGFESLSIAVAEGEVSLLIGLGYLGGVLFLAWFLSIYGIGYVSELYGTLVLDGEISGQAGAVDEIAKDLD